LAFLSPNSISNQLLVLAAAIQVYLAYSVARNGPEEGRGKRAAWVWGLCALGWLWLAASFVAGNRHYNHVLPPVFGDWLGASGALCLVATAALVPLVKLAEPSVFRRDRRDALRLTAAAMVAAPAAATGYGMFVERSTLRVREVDVLIPGLPADLNGLRIGQISDIHRGAFLERKTLDRAVAALNETQPNLTVITGDLISRRGDPVDDCLDSLRVLRADAGVLGCLGNHEIYASSQSYVARNSARIGHTYLRNTAKTLRFGSSELNVVGVDYQPMHTDYLEKTAGLVRPGAVNLLLSHNPDVLHAAAEQGFQLVLSGHTHGGQVSVELLHEHWNVARFYTPYVYGLYQRGGTSIYVNGGLGTIGIPIRLGVAPEVAVIRLCAV
jgi:uncharacterized protein